MLQDSFERNEAPPAHDLPEGAIVHDAVVDPFREMSMGDHGVQASDFQVAQSPHLPGWISFCTPCSYSSNRRPYELFRKRGPRL
jgi:hypothetical protein